MSGKLHLVGSPIGNPIDVSQRLTESLLNAKYICVEDPDRFIQFCDNYNLYHSAELIDICYSENNDREFNIKQRIIDILNSGEDVYIISDEGMPALADPGKIIIDEAIKNGIELVISPGPSTVLAAASVANVLNNFIFEGFMPFDDGHRHDRFKFLQTSYSPMIFLLHNPNSRPIDTDDKIHVLHNCSNADFFINDAIQFFGENRLAVFCIDLTTAKQKIIRGTLKEVKNYILDNIPMPGNLCIVIDGYLNNMYKYFSDVK